MAVQVRRKSSIGYSSELFYLDQNHESSYWGYQIRLHIDFCLHFFTFSYWTQTSKFGICADYHLFYLWFY